MNIISHHFQTVVKNRLMNYCLFIFITADYQSSLVFAGESSTQEVIVTGVGATADGALKNAFTQAVQNVVGTLVNASTLVKNDQIITDKVLTLSNGYIPKYEEVETHTLNGLVYRKISATVKREQLQQRLQELSVINVDEIQCFPRRLPRGLLRLKLRRCFKTASMDSLPIVLKQALLNRS